MKFTKDCKTFKKLVQDVFSFKEEDVKISTMNQSTSLPLLEKIIAEKASNEFKLFPNKNWIEKCVQIYTLSNTFKSKLYLQK